MLERRGLEFSSGVEGELLRLLVVEDPHLVLLKPILAFSQDLAQTFAESNCRNTFLDVSLAQ